MALVHDQEGGGHAGRRLENRRRVIACRFARSPPSSFRRASTRRCARVCGHGMNSSLDTLCVGIGAGYE